MVKNRQDILRRKMALLRQHEKLPTPSNRLSVCQFIPLLKHTRQLLVGNP